MKTTIPYYDYKKILSYNAVYHIIVDRRGSGKTYGAKTKAVRDWVKTRAEFVYVRRYKTELTLSKLTFFSDFASDFPDWDFRVMGQVAQASHASSRNDKKREWETVGYFVALSNSQSLKSVAFPKVKTIIFDEFIIENANIQYIRDEPTVFNNLYSTIARTREGVRVFMLGNAVSIMTPYFGTFGIEPENLPEIGVLHNGFLAYHFPRGDAFAQHVYRTRFGQFIEGTEYADYAVGNQFADGSEALLAEKPPEARYRFTLETKAGTFSVWSDWSHNLYYAQEKRPSADEAFFTMLPEKMSEEKTLLTFSDKPLSALRTEFRHGRLVFDKPRTRNAFIQVFRR